MGGATISADGRTAYATVVPATALGEVSVEEAEAILDVRRFEPAEGTGVQVEAGGQLGSKISKLRDQDERAGRHRRRDAQSSSSSSARSARCLAHRGGHLRPVLRLSLNFAPRPRGRRLDVAPTVATMIGLGVGIDYRCSSSPARARPGTTG